MNILSEETSNGVLKVKTNKNLFEITLDEKLELSRKYKGTWWGASYQDGISTLMFKIDK